MFRARNALVRAVLLKSRALYARFERPDWATDHPLRRGHPSSSL